MGSIAVGLVSAIFALAQVVILAFFAFERHRGEFPALVRTIAKRLLAAQATHAKIIFFVFIETYFARLVVRYGWIGHATPLLGFVTEAPILTNADANDMDIKEPKKSGPNRVRF